ncbi:MAG: GDP-mannose 4,6-dehydratase [Mycobacteriales bacterium]
MRVLVTGAAGFIASTLVDRLLAEGHQVTGVDNLSTGRLDNLAEARAGNQASGEGERRFTFVRTDVCDTSFNGVVEEARPEAICHLAAQVDVRKSVSDPMGDAAANVLGTVSVLEGARRAGVGKVVFASSGGSIYGTPSQLPVTERAGLAPESPYAAGKAAGELYLHTYRHLYGVGTTALALGNVYGPRQDPHGEAGVVAIFGGALLGGRPTFIYGDGKAVRDYVYVDDVVDAFVRALPRAAADGRRINIGTGQGTSVRELHAAIAAAVGAPDTPGFADPRPGELQAIVLDASAARRSLGWRPFTSLETGVGQTVRWLRERGSRAG